MPASDPGPALVRAVYEDFRRGVTVEQGPQRRAREQREAEERARLTLQASRMRRVAEAARARDLAWLQADEKARRDAVAARRRLADAADAARARDLPNPWLRPGDIGYETPTEARLRAAEERAQREARRRRQAPGLRLSRAQVLAGPPGGAPEVSTIPARDAAAARPAAARRPRRPLPRFLTEACASGMFPTEALAAYRLANVPRVPRTVTR